MMIFYSVCYVKLCKKLCFIVKCLLLTQLIVLYCSPVHGLYCKLLHCQKVHKLNVK